MLFNVEFYNDNEVLPNFLIRDKKNGIIEEGKEGIFFFAPFISNARLHYLLVGKNDYQFLNMKESIDLNISKLLDFFEQNNYSKEDILFYLRDFIDTYQQNEEMIARFNGIIK